MRAIMQGDVSGSSFISSLNANFLQLYRSYARNAEDYGMSSSTSAATNTAALQAALNGGNCSVLIRFGTGTGVFEISDTIWMDSNTSLVCEPGVVLKKVFIGIPLITNRGHLTKTYNENITVDGLTIEDEYGIGSSIYGLGSVLAFYYIKNLTIKNYKCVVDAYSLGISIGKFEHVILDNIQLEGEKCGINFWTGHDALVNNYVSSTYDDAGCISTASYPQFFFEVGDVYDITWRNCTVNEWASEIPAKGGGRFCEFLPSSWADWQTGNNYITGDLCLNAGHLYQSNNVVGFSGTGTVAPTHTTGQVTGADGITWRYKNDTAVYHADIWNITFDNIINYQRKMIFYANLNMDTGYARLAYPGTEELSSVDNISIINSNWKNGEGTCPLFAGDGCLKNVIVANNIMDGLSQLYFNGNGIIYTTLHNTLNISLTGNVFKNMSSGIGIICNAHEDIFIQSSGNICDNCDFSFNLITDGATVRLNGIDLKVRDGQIGYFTPEIGDMVNNYSGAGKGLYIYKAGGWINLAV